MSDVPEMVERVARAMCVADNRRDPDDASGGVHPLGQILDEGEPWWRGFVDVARAAIEAMRDGPTETAFAKRPGTASSDVNPVCWTPKVIERHRHIWRDWIGVCLREAPKPNS